MKGCGFCGSLVCWDSWSGASEVFVLLWQGGNLIAFIVWFKCLFGEKNAVYLSLAFYFLLTLKHIWYIGSLIPSLSCSCPAHIIVNFSLYIPSLFFFFCSKSLIQYVLCVYSGLFEFTRCLLILTSNNMLKINFSKSKNIKHYKIINLTLQKKVNICLEKASNSLKIAYDSKDRLIDVI